MRESSRDAEAALEATENHLFEPADVYLCTIQHPVVPEPLPDLPSFRRVIVSPSPVVQPPVQRDALAALGSICEVEGLTRPTIIYQLLELFPSWVRTAAMVHQRGDAAADPDLGNGKGRCHNLVR